MKTDRILFGLACLGLGYITHSAINKDVAKEQVMPEHISQTMPKIKSELKADTVMFEKCLKDSTILKDTTKLVRRGLK